MGIVLSSNRERGREAENVTSESETMNVDPIRNDDNTEEEFHDADEHEAREKAKEEEMNEFRKQLSIKREQRKEILARHRTEKEDLEKSLKNERASKLELYQKNEQLRQLLLSNKIKIPEYLQSPSETSELSETILQMREDFEKLKKDNNKLRRDLVDANNSLQGAYSDIADLNTQNLESIKQIHALKEVVSVSKTLINLREGQLNELKEKLGEIERSLSDREASMLSSDLRQEYERQLQNIRTLRGLYEERARLAEVTRQGLVRDLEEQKALYHVENNRCNDLVAKVVALETKVDALEETIENKNIDISTCQDEKNQLKAEMTVVNKLFSQVLLGYKTKQDLDKLVHRLEENHGLLTHMAEKEDDAEASSALPKLLLELVSQVDEHEEIDESEKSHEQSIPPGEEPSSFQEPAPSTTAEEIVENLPKVWRVLMELLSHQTVVEDSSEKVTTCYKSVETKSGPVLVPSVSQTYIRLKDLIVEKLGLIKEVNRMKQLNNHLETRLQEQEKRLCLVTTELSKTWHVVGKLRRHHYQLHTHEKILKYELQQKRKLLNELKEELEYCREKWEQAREKNTQSERDWRKLRAEFSSRKTKSGSPLFNNSGESGYSDERPSDDSSESNDESEYLTEPLNRCKKKLKKSFENVLDSSADFNLAAEREDPVSDMIDVADLPLDTQESGDSHEASAECSKSEDILKSEKTCETEDEIGDITNDDVLAEQSGTKHGQNRKNCNIANSENNTIAISNSSLESTSPSSRTQSENAKPVNPAEILLNIRKQNERLAKKDERLEKLEKSSAELLKKTQTTTKISQEINSTLNHLINRPTSSFSKQEAKEDINQSETTISTYETPVGTSNLQTVQVDPKIEQSTLLNATVSTNKSNETDTLSAIENQSTDLLVEDSSQSTCQNNEITPAQMPANDFKAILENIKQQNERLAKKDERLHMLETDCNEVVKNISSTLKIGEEIIEKLDSLHNEYANSNQGEVASKEDSVVVADKDLPSTSTDNDHEARFAARDLRLKRLEEQTKSLVKKVNKTTSKGVKINYKLDELHNIYGSESSRAGTPSEETEDRSIDEDNDTNE